MSKEKNISVLSLLFRYLILAVMTLTLAAIIVASFWMVHLYVRYTYVAPGFGGSGDGGLGDYFYLDEIRKAGSVKVAWVNTPSPAGKAGIQAGDSIVAVNGISLQDTPQAFYRPFVGAGPGKKIDLEVIRKGAREHVTLILEDMSACLSPKAYLGISPRWLTPEIADSLNLTAAPGVLIDSVFSGTAAAKAGLRARDVIVSFDGQRLTDMGQFGSFMMATAPGKRVELGLLREGQNLTLSATMGGKDFYSISFTGSHIRGSPRYVIWTYFLPFLFSRLSFLSLAQR